MARTPEQHLAQTDPRMAELIARARRFEKNIAPLVRPFDALAESIAYQQLSGKAAATIWGRVKALYPRRKWLDPKLILATPDETFRAAGLSGSKTRALKDLAAKTLDGTVPTGRALAKMSRRRNHRAADHGARDRKMDGRDAASLRSRPLGCLARGGLRRAQRFRENFWSQKTADTQTAVATRRKVPSLPLCRCMVFLARAREDRDAQSL